MASVNPDYEPPTRSDNSVVQYLREHGPATSDELPGLPSNSRARELVGRLRVVGGSRGGTPVPDRPSLQPAVTIYYLYGDERRAVRKFIDEHTDLVEWAMDRGDTVVSGSLDPIIYQMLTEEWRWRETRGAVE